MCHLQLDRCIWNLHAKWESEPLKRFVENQQRSPAWGLPAPLTCNGSRTIMGKATKMREQQQCLLVTQKNLFMAMSQTVKRWGEVGKVCGWVSKLRLVLGVLNHNVSRASMSPYEFILGWYIFFCLFKEIPMGSKGFWNAMATMRTDSLHSNN